MGNRGDLADIIRGSKGGGGGSSGGGFGNKLMTSSEELPVDPTWHFASNPTIFSSDISEERLDYFGDPYPSMQDPLLQELDTPISKIFCTSNNTTQISNNDNIVTNNVFSRMGYHQITSPVDKLAFCPVVSAASLPRKSTTSILVSSDNLIDCSGTSIGGHVRENQVLQISSPPNTDIKRRRSQVKKVVCIPAPAPENSSGQSGEVVPSDLWAWRKYGQKPIKGSPYPRGYYRCSSSKGCSARKQVERSRTDPKMLVITYTCEHNHPWPTQRNARAGSTRSSSHALKNNTASSHQNPNNENATNIAKEDDQKNVKEEEIMEDIHRRIDMENQVPSFSQTYSISSVPDKSNLAKLSIIPLNSVDIMDTTFKSMMGHPEDLFGDLGSDPLNILFQNKQTAALDPFGFFDWGVDNSESSNSVTVADLLGGELKGGVQKNP